MSDPVDLRVACPGGIIAPAALRTIAELSGAWGADRLRIGCRQDLLVEGIAAAYEERFRAAVAPLAVDRLGDGAAIDAHPNITSSAPAAGIVPGVRWLDAAAIRHVLAGIRFRPSVAVNVTDPNQDLLPLTAGLLNFLAADEAHAWRISIAADHHPRRRARGTGSQDRVTLPCLVPSEHVAEVVKVADEAVGDHDAGAPTLADLARTIRLRLGAKLVEATDRHPVPPAEYGEYEGVHPMPAGAGYWIGLSTGTVPYRWRFLERLCMRAAEEGIDTLFATPWRSWVLKGVRQESLPAWRTLFGRHGVRVRHVDAASTGRWPTGCPPRPSCASRWSSACRDARW